jgi:predicted Zn-dependent protease
MATAASALLQIGCGLVFFVFMIGQCVGETKSMLACVGVRESAPKLAVQFRTVDPSSPGDARMARSLLNMAQAGGIPPEEIRAVVAQVPEINAANFGARDFMLFEGLHGVPDSTLDAIMAHEVAHALLGHVSEFQTRADTIGRVTRLLGAVVGTGSEGRSEVASWALEVSMPAFSREQEFAADAKAIEILRTAGYHSDAAGTLCDALSEFAALEQRRAAGFWDSHPASAERIERIQRARQSR